MTYFIDESILRYVFGDQVQDIMEENRSAWMNLSLDNLEEYIDSQLNNIMQNFPPSKSAGRLGPSHVVFDVSSNVGSLVIDCDRLGIASQSNFSTIRANCCVYKGKWMYELMLGSKGVMQVGWATAMCQFSQEKGVGDTPDSYAFDGNRIRKWNVATYRYGEPWLIGDIIGCALDLDNGCVHFYRNGEWLGEAFGNVRVGAGMAYFPAVTLAYNENLVANFGASPLQYPISGYQALEEIPKGDALQAGKLLIWLEKLVHLVSQVKENKDSGVEQKKSKLLLLAAPVMYRLGPLLTTAYVTKACLVPLVLKLCADETPSSSHQAVPAWNVEMNALLDIMWALMELHEVHQCLEHLVVALVTGYRFSPGTEGLWMQRQYLRTLLAVIQHDRSRQFLLRNVLFDKIKFPMILEVKTLDTSTLKKMVPQVWFDKDQEAVTEDEKSAKNGYSISCRHLSRLVSTIEELQFKILVELFTQRDLSNGVSSRTLFLSKFEEFLKENFSSNRVPVAHLCPLPVGLSFFHRMITLLLSYLRSSEVAAVDDFYIPLHMFYDDSINYFGAQRVGGVVSHLQKSLHEELTAALAKDAGTSDSDQQPGQSGKSELKAISKVLDGAIRLYQTLAHRQLGKASHLQENMREYLLALKKNKEQLGKHEAEVEAAFQHAQDVFQEKLVEQARQFAWVKASVYSKEKQLEVYWLFQVLLRTLHKASAAGPLFAFVPDFYIEACISCFNALHSYFSVVHPMEELQDVEGTLLEYGKFLVLHFADPRVVNAELKDSLVHALAMFVCVPHTVRALESMPVEHRLVMVKALLQPYENRAWAQSNWILVRLWKGCGFAFRYTMPPHLSKRFSMKQLQQSESFHLSHHKPCPSLVFQRHVAEWLLDNPDLAAGFLSSVMSQLNWAFSEFIGMLQEIQNAINRPERVFIDTRQLKICATCFDLALGLLRVLEMIVSICPKLFTDWSRPSGEILLTQLCQLLCQVLNRVTSHSGCFELVVNLEIPGLETVDHFPILAAVSGILISLLLKASPDSCEPAITTLLTEPSFSPSQLDFLLGESNAQHQPPDVFSFRNYEEVSDEEIQNVQKLIELLQSRHKAMSSTGSPQEIAEEDVCTICYANRKSATFHPCSHQSCRSCISLHLLHHHECFFCKTTIAKVELPGGKTLDLPPKSTS